MSLRVVPVTLKQAQEFVREWHRHHKPSAKHKFSVGVATDEDVLVGVAIVGRPVARHYDDGMTLEVARTCTDGTFNANSMLYGAAWRVAREMGYRRLITYTQEDEPGASLRGAGWSVVAQRPPRPGWNTPSRPRENKNQHVARTLWEVTAHEPP